MSRLFYMHMVFATLALIAFSCEEKKDLVKEIEPVPVDTSQLVRWHLFNDISLHNMSFPNWINSEQVKVNELDTIIITLRRYREVTDTILSKDTFPDEIWRFSFNNEGWIKNLTIEEYSEGIHIASHEFDYQNKPDSMGYSAPSLSTQYLFNQNNTQLMGILNQVEDLKIFNRLLLESSDSTTLKYKNVLSQQRAKHIYILDSANWNVRFIDQNFKAEGEDYYYFGTPKKFIQCFKLHNLVEKNLIQVNTYFPNGVINSQELHEGEFYRLRTFKYEKDGRCSHLIDSVFSTGKEYVFNENVNIEYSRNNPELPKSINIYTGKDSANPKMRYLLEYVRKD